MKFEFSLLIFQKVWNIKFYQNPASGSRVVPCGQTDMTKLIVAFRNFANAPNKNVFPNKENRKLLNFSTWMRGFESSSDSCKITLWKLAHTHWKAIAGENEV